MVLLPAEREKVPILQRRNYFYKSATRAVYSRKKLSKNSHFSPAVQVMIFHRFTVCLPQRQLPPGTTYAHKARATVENWQRKIFTNLEGVGAGH